MADVDIETSAPWTTAHRLSLAVFVTLAALISAVLLIEVKSLVLSSPGETLNHLFASGGFTLAASGLLLLFSRGRPGAFAVMVAGALITVALEAAQAITPTRDAEIDDLLAGLTGVLLTSIAIEAMSLMWKKRTSLRIHVGLASVASIALVGLLTTNWAPGTVLTASPDGVSCPLTEIGPDGAVFTIGATPISNGCLRTGSGGLGVVGSWNPTDQFDHAVLVTSGLGDLRDRVHRSERLHIRAEITTDDLTASRRGVIALLRTTDGRHIVNIRSYQDRLEVTGPNLDHPLQASAYAQALSSHTTHTVDIVLTATELRLEVDDLEVGTTTMDPDWIDSLADEQLQLLIGNNAHRSTPFRGIIERVEIGS